MSKGLNGTWRVRERGTSDTIAHVRIPDGGLAQWRPLGRGEWVENREALGLLLGDAGAVERLPDNAPPEG